jgi:glycine/D-amino acid oxidase-like deaminating enzyme
MIKLPDKQVTFLKPDGFKPLYPKLDGHIEVDTVVVGGGIIGITAAYLLKQGGHKVAVLERKTIGNGTTGHTTGKVTAQHNLLYTDLQERLGVKTARVYGLANLQAVEEIDRVIKKEKIDCGWERADNYVYTTKKQKAKQFQQEAKAAQSLGLPASFQTTSPLPFKIAAAVKFDNQAHFSAQKYIEALAKKIQGQGSFVFENSRAVAFFDGSPCRVKAFGGSVTAKNIIVATNVPTSPLLARFSYCIMEYPHTSYLVAGRPKIKLKGMYISPDKGYYSLLPVGKGKDQILLVGGENHIPGLGRPKNRHQKLADFGQKHFGMNKVEYCWGARDYIAYDGIPLIGKLYPWSKNLYVATAFKKWGLSHSMVAGLILRDLVTNQKNEWAEVYNPHRFSVVRSIPQAVAKELS